MIRASAVVSGASNAKISGEATFEQKDDGILPTVMVRLRVKGLEPIAFMAFTFMRS
jgi:hypothetical protein